MKKHIISFIFMSLVFIAPIMHGVKPSMSSERQLFGYSLIAIGGGIFGVSAPAIAVMLLEHKTVMKRKKEDENRKEVLLRKIDMGSDIDESVENQKTNHVMQKVLAIDIASSALLETNSLERPDNRKNFIRTLGFAAGSLSLTLGGVYLLVRS